MGKFLDYQGLTYYDENIKEYIDEHGGGSSLPEYPTNDGNYSLVLTMVEGVGTLAWNSITGVWQLPTQIANDLRIFQCTTINKINNNLEVY